MCFSVVRGKPSQSGSCWAPLRWRLRHWALNADMPRRGCRIARRTAFTAVERLYNTFTRVCPEPRIRFNPPCRTNVCAYAWKPRHVTRTWLCAAHGRTAVRRSRCSSPTARNVQSLNLLSRRLDKKKSVQFKLYTRPTSVLNKTTKNNILARTNSIPNTLSSLLLFKNVKSCFWILLWYLRPQITNSTL